MNRLSLLAGASLLGAVTLTAAAGAQAQVATHVYNSGNGLFAPYLRQAEDCYGNPTDLVIQGPTIHSPTTVTIAPFNYIGSPPFNCATSHVDPTVELDTIETGSGTSIKAVYSHDSATFWGDTVPPGNNNSPYPTVNFGTSETPLGTADVSVYNAGGVEQGVTFTATPGAGQYPIPAPLYGPLIQFPMLIAPLAIAYDSVYKKVRQADSSIVSYHFHLKKPRTNGSGGLVLNAATYCAIFNGQITNWNDPALQALNGGVSLKDPADPGTFSVPITMVGRSDSAGATSTWTRHLAAICPTVISGNQYPDSASTLPVALQGPAWTKTNPNFGTGSGVTDVPGKYTRAAGADGVADYIEFDPANVPAAAAGSSVVQGRMGYDGNDDVLPDVANTGQNTFGLQSASLLRVAGSTAIAPTAASALLAYNKNILPPTGGNQSQPDLWVQPPSKTAAIAIPQNVKAYPIVGTSNFLGYTCYANAGVTSALKQFLNWFETSPVTQNAANGNLAASGSSAMPKAWRTAITATFLAPNANTRPLNLFILTAGTGPVSGNGSQCHAVTTGG